MQALNLTVLGAAGRTGREIVGQALEAGHAVTVLVRHPEKLGALRARVTVVVGDARDPIPVARAVAGADAVLSALGHVHGSAVTVLSAAAANVVAAMCSHGVRRLVVLTSSAVRGSDDHPTIGQRVLLAVLDRAMGQLRPDDVAQARVIASSGLDWTVVRAALLTNGPRSRRCRACAIEGAAGWRIARSDIAAFMLAVVTDGSYMRRMPFLSQ
jgi:putative NADH-flavin reductase